ncbi:unnamed protein product, partial [Mesorhabditis belari]|uniref:long-chain-fatty-acid--CoA ligase n=1 Tax=Mesorhabditis belari TaxID=2138241 RepID=A0AAF3J6N5_9BILA
MSGNNGKEKKYDASNDKTLKQVVKGESPLWIRFVIGILRVWFVIYDCLNYIPYQLFNSPAEKLRKSGRTKAKWVDEEERDGPIENVDGTIAMDYPGKDTADKLWRHVVSIYGDKDALGTRRLLEVVQEKQPNGRLFEKWSLGEYEWMSYKDVERNVQQLAAGIKDLSAGLDDPKVVIYAETRAHWLIVALACFRAKVTVVTVYATLGEEAIASAINETEAFMLVTSAELVEKIGSNICSKCPTVHTLMYFPPVDTTSSGPDLEVYRNQFKHIFTFSALKDRSAKPILESTAEPSDLALIMYTSGTTGQAKGVMLLHSNLVAAIAGQGNGVKKILTDADTYIGYLPLAHILEMDAELTALSRGCRVGYSSPLTLHDRASKILKGTHGDCYALRPTVMAAVPAIMDRIFKAVTEEVAASPRFMQELFKLNYERKRARYQDGYCSPFLDRIIFKKIRKLLGGKLRGVLSGGAPLNPETQRFMNICMCCPVIQGYGLTESCGAACIADTEDLSTGTVGPPVRCARIALREWSEAGYSPYSDPSTGEILISGPHIAAGYWKQPEKTREDFIEHKGLRYFATGDIGLKRDDGSLTIIDRKKDLVKLSSGEYVSLAKVECALLNCPIVDNICVYGNSLEDSTIALVVPNAKHLQKIAEEVSVTSTDIATLCREDSVVKAFKKKMEEHAIKNKLHKSEIPSAIHLCEEEWTPQSGLLTEALKLKRKPIEKKYETMPLQPNRRIFFSGAKETERFKKSYQKSRTETTDDRETNKTMGMQILTRADKERAKSPVEQKPETSTSVIHYPQLTRRPISTDVAKTGAKSTTGATTLANVSKTTELPQMTDGIRLIGEHLEFFDQINEYLSDTNACYSVIGAIGPQGVGKSTLLSMIGGNTSQEMYRQYIFRPCSREAIEGSRHQTACVYVYVTKTRMILIDCQAMNSGSLLDDAIRSNRGGIKIDDRLEVAKNMEVLQIISFLIHVCHVLIFNVDWFIDFELIKMIRLAETLRANLPQVATQLSLPQLNSTRKVFLMIVHARAKEVDCLPINKAMRIQLIRKIFADSSRIKISEDDNAVYFCTEEIKLRQENANIEQKVTERALQENFDATMCKLRPLLATLCSEHFTKDNVPFSEKQWLRIAKLIWSDSAFNSTAARLAQCI